jgi:hypothetical protein
MLDVSRDKVIYAVIHNALVAAQKLTLLSTVMLARIFVCQVGNVSVNVHLGYLRYFDHKQM